MFYSAEELSIVMQELGYRNVKVKTVFAGMMAFHTAVKPLSLTAKGTSLAFG